MGRKPKAAGPRKTSVALDPEKWRQVRRIALDQRTTASALIERCVDQVIARAAQKGRT
jgi:predicted DNA-binding ribbon-helix-helix protein